MKRVLLVTDIFPPDIGGPATFIPALATELTSLGYAVTVFCRAERLTKADDTTWPFRVCRFPRQNGRVSAAKLMAMLLREVLRHRIVFSNGLERQTEWACRIVGRPYVLKVVGDLAWERSRLNGLTQLSIDEFQIAPITAAPWRKWAARRAAFARHARMVVTPSEYLRRIVIGWSVDAQQVVTVFNGVRLEEFRSFIPNRRTGSTFEVVFIGRLVNWKGVEHLLHALVPMADIRLSVIGEGPEGPALRSLAASLGLSGVVNFLGTLPRSAVLRHLARAHALVLPSEYEGLSHVLLEACAAGVPSIASDRGGNPEVIEPERSGLLVPYGDVLQLRAALQRLQSDEDFRLKLAVGAKARSRQFDFRTTVADTVRLLIA